MPFAGTTVSLTAGTAALIYTAADDDDQVFITYDAAVSSGVLEPLLLGGSSSDCVYALQAGGFLGPGSAFGSNGNATYQNQSFRSKVRAGDTLYALCAHATTVRVLVRSA